MKGYIAARPLRFGLLGSEPDDDESDIYGNVQRIRAFRWRWEITEGPAGPVIGEGHAWTADGAWYAALKAACEVAQK